MKNALTEIPDFFRISKFRNNKQLLIFLICLAIATVLWFLNALGKYYSTTVSYPVKYVNLPKSRFISNKLPDRLDFHVEAYGFTLLRHKLSLSFSPILLNVTEITKNIVSGNGIYNVYTSGLIKDISSQVSNEISIKAVLPEVLSIHLDSLRTKPVPVKPNVIINFVSQYNVKDSVNTLPDRVFITGPASLIDTIKFIRTENRLFDKVDTDIEKVIPLEHPENTTVKPEKVTLQIQVEKYTEKELKIPVKVIDTIPGAEVKLFPSEVRVNFLVGLSNFEKISPADFMACVNPENITPDKSSLDVIIAKSPPNVQITRIYPQAVEFLTENK